MHEETMPIGSRFHLGKLVATPNALDALFTHGLTPHDLLRRHMVGDWGCLCPADAQANEAALICGSRLLSIYIVGNTKVWVITEGDRTVTTILLPTEY